MSQSFIGDYFLNPYFARFDEAINLAAERRQDRDIQEAEADDEAAPLAPAAESSKARRRSYTLVKAHNVGYTAIILFAKDPERIRDLQDAEVGFGAAEMGNKGAVGLRMLYDVGGDGTLSTELTFVATHLAAMEWNLAKRNANWAAIMRGMTFGNPEAVLDQVRGSEGTPTSTPRNGDDDDDGSVTEQQRLLRDAHDEQHRDIRRQLHDISVFKATSNLFVAGDLNYRISTSAPPPNAAFPNLDPDSENYYPNFFPLDQLTRERTAGRTMHGLSEHEVRFPPTYKYDVQPKRVAGSNDEDEGEVPWKFAPHRYPSWTDRVLFLDLPSWVKSKSTEPQMDVRAYDALPLMRSSDHRPVYLRVEVPLISPKDMAPPEDVLEGGESENVKDPRVRLPVEVDPEAWERRKAARRKELITGWSAFLWSTKEGAWILATLLVAGMGSYWLYKAS